MLVEHGRRFDHRDGRDRSKSIMTCSHALRAGISLAFACGFAFHALALSGCGDDGSPPVDTPDAEPPTPIDATLDADASLTDLRISRGTLNPIFAPHVTTYQMSLSLLVNEIVVTPTAASDAATITVNGTAVPSGQAGTPIPLALGENPITVEVTAEAGNTQSYTLSVMRIADAIADRYVKPAMPVAGTRLGDSVAIDGDYLAMGAPFESSGDPDNPADTTAPESGAVYIFRRDGASWLPDRYLKASNLDELDHFGIRVAVSGDTLAVAATGESSGDAANPDDDSFVDSGAVYVFRRDTAGWQEEAYLKAPNLGPIDRFGSSIALEGDVLVVGATGEDSADPSNPADNNARDSGAVYVFRRTGTTWQQEAYLKASNRGSGDAFGSSLALDGDALVVGAPAEDSPRADDPASNTAQNSGAAYVFRRIDTVWQEEAYLKANNAGGNDIFGSSVVIDGDLLVVGAPGEASSDPNNPNDNLAEESGAAYVFQHGTGWSQVAYLKPAVPMFTDAFGTSVALAAGVLAVGAPNANRATMMALTSASGARYGSMLVSADIVGCDPFLTPGACVVGAGAVYLYIIDSGTWEPAARVDSGQFYDTNDAFGSSVALTPTGVLAVGMPREDSGVRVSPADNSALDSGAVYLFE
jgi:hypothetical protein